MTEIMMKSRRVIFVLLGAAITLGLSACQQDLKMGDDGGLPSRDMRDCAVSGGTVEVRGKLHTPVCVHPYADAGKSCSRKNDCQGKCIATGERGELPKLGQIVAGHCQPNNKLFGCYAEVEGGKAKAAICVD
jgi:hypothetical protein